MSTEKKDISQYLHFYLGCECMLEERIVVKLTGFENNKPVIKHPTKWEFAKVIDHELIKPLLYRLEDITEENAIELVKLSSWKQYGSHPHNRVYTTHKNPFGQIVVSWGDGLREKKVPELKEVFSPEEFDFLIKKGYWLFGNHWFDEGIIIDRKTLKQ